jgi:DNA-binding SARP family transcriptional activator
MARLALALLGSFRATLDGRPVDGLNSDHLRALLAYLAVESRQGHPRQQVASLLWPERSDQEALSALRYALSNLHHALDDRRSPSPYLLVTRNSLQFNLTSDHWLDLSEFQNLGSRLGIPSLEQAAALYRGHFLEGFSLGDSPAFEEWMLWQEEKTRSSFLSLLDRLVSFQLRTGETDQAARWARKQLELDPYRER